MPRTMSPKQSGAAPEGPTGALTLRTAAMPADTNPSGDIFGGWVLSQMDIAGGLAAIERVRGRTVTVAVDKMTFITPVKVGDILAVYCQIERVGRTSVSVLMEAWVHRGHDSRNLKVTEGRFVYVAVDADGRPTPIRPVA